MQAQIPCVFGRMPWINVPVHYILVLKTVQLKEIFDVQKKYVMWNSEQLGDAAKLPESALKVMAYFGENSPNCRFPGIEVNEENQAKLQRLVEEYHLLKEEEEHKELSLISFFKGKGINIEHVDEFEEPREIFILLIYFKEICKLTDFEPVAVIEKEFRS